MLTKMAFSTSRRCLTSSWSSSSNRKIIEMIRLRYQRKSRTSQYKSKLYSSSPKYQSKLRLKQSTLMQEARREAESHKFLFSNIYKNIRMNSMVMSTSSGIPEISTVTASWTGRRRISMCSLYQSYSKIGRNDKPSLKEGST